MVEPAIFGPLDAALAPVIEYVVLALVFANLLTRFAAHRNHVNQAEDGGADAIQRHPVHEASNALVLLAAFYYTTLHLHGGVVLSVLALGMVIADFFEFEARRVEARQDFPIDAPKGAIVGSLLVLSYAAYLALFFLVEDYWGAIV